MSPVVLAWNWKYWRKFMLYDVERDLSAGYKNVCWGTVVYIQLFPVPS